MKQNAIAQYKGISLKVILAVLVFPIPLFAQNQPDGMPAACGNFGVSMAVDLDNSQHAIADAEPGKARIYFIQETGVRRATMYPTTKIGMDGNWVGANKKDSYFSVSVDPGEHHLCAVIQSSYIMRNLELAHLTAEAGKIYYFRTRIFVLSDSGSAYLTLTPVDSDEAKYLIVSSSSATAHTKK